MKEVFESIIERLKKISKEYVYSSDAYEQGKFSHMYNKSTEHINCSTDKSIELLSRSKGSCNHKVCDEVIYAYKKILEEYNNSEIQNMSDSECAWETDHNIFSGMYKRNTGCGYTFYDVMHL